MRLSLHASLTCTLLLSATAALSQTPVPPAGPVVSMNITPPDGRPEELVTHESGLVTVDAAGREYGFRPTMHDDEGRRITVTIFDMGSATESVREIGTVEVSGGGPAVASTTTPRFQIRAQTRDQIVGTSGTQRH